MKKVLFFFSETIVGGAETNIVKISRELIREGYEVHFASLEDKGPLMQSVDFKIGSFTEIGLFQHSPFSSVKKYKKLISTHQIDIVFNFGLRVEIFSRLLSKSFGVKKVISNIRSTDDWRKFYHTWLDNMTAHNTDLWVANSEAGRQAFHSREGIPLERIEVIYNFIDELTPSAIDEKDLTAPLKIGVLANITKLKGHFDLIPLSKSLSEKNIDHTFYLGGVDKIGGQFHQKVEKEGLSHHFVFMGYVTDKMDFFKGIDLFLLPSYLEGMPTVVLESMAHGKPVISTKVGGIPEVISHEYNGLIYEPGDINGFTEGISLLMNGKKRATLIENAFAVLKTKFSKEVCMQKWINIINSTC